MCSFRSSLEIDFGSLTMTLNCDGLKFENAGFKETLFANPMLQALVISVKFTVGKPATKRV